MTHLSYRSPDFTEDPDEFDETRWVGTRKSAATVGPGYLAFGLGRWACPGRFLAVNGKHLDLREIYDEADLDL